MDNLPALRSLVAALEQGSFSAAARSLRISQPAVSQHIHALETWYGQSLLHRSRLGVRPTEAGELAARYARQALGSLDALSDELAALKGELTGRLVVASPIFMSELLLFPVVARLNSAHPGLRISLNTSDELIDIDAQGVDMAFRAGSPGSGGGKVRKFAEIDTCLVASREYLAREGAPSGPDDLTRLSYVQYIEDPDEVSLVLKGPDGEITAPVRPAFAARLSSLILHAARNHMGFVRVGRPIVAEDLASGRLVELLAETPPLSKPFYLVTSSAFAPSRRSDVFLHEVETRVRAMPGLRFAGAPLA